MPLRGGPMEGESSSCRNTTKSSRRNNTEYVIVRPPVSKKEPGSLVFNDFALYVRRMGGGGGGQAGTTLQTEDSMHNAEEDHDDASTLRQRQRNEKTKSTNYRAFRPSNAAAEHPAGAGPTSSYQSDFSRLFGPRAAPPPPGTSETTRPFSRELLNRHKFVGVDGTRRIRRGAPAVGMVRGPHISAQRAPVASGEQPSFTVVNAAARKKAEERENKPSALPWYHQLLLADEDGEDDARIAWSEAEKAWTVNDRSRSASRSASRGGARNRATAGPDAKKPAQPKNREGGPQGAPNLIRLATPR